VSAKRKLWDVKRRGRGWAVQRVDAVAADSIHAQRAHAIARGLEIAGNAHGRLRIKDVRGRVEREVSFDR
jgi:hypothetical protein